MSIKAAADKFLDMLESKKSLEVLQEIAALQPDKRRAAIANPTSYFKKAGFKLPRGVTLTIGQQPVDPGQPVDPQGPLARPEMLCFWVRVEISRPFSQPYVVWKLVCVRVNVGPFGEITPIGALN